MSVENRVGNLFEEQDLQVLLHCCNLHHTFGAGIAKVVKKLYPEAYDADLATPKDDPAKLGTYSFGVAADGKMILNLYAMPAFGEFSYDAFYEVMDSIEKKLRSAKRKFVLGIPYKVGCDLAGGKYLIVNAILREIFEFSPVKLVIVRLPEVNEERV